MIVIGKLIDTAYKLRKENEVESGKDYNRDYYDLAHWVICQEATSFEKRLSMIPPAFVDKNHFKKLAIDAFNSEYAVGWKYPNAVEAIFNIAWEDGHAHGYRKVWNHMCEAHGLLEAITKDIESEE